MKHFDILRTITFLILSCFIFSGASCFNKSTTEPDVNCGPDTDWLKRFDALQVRSLGVTGGIREFIYDESKDIDGICSYEHIQVQYFAQLEHNNTSRDSLQILGNTYWSFYGRETTLKPDVPSGNLYIGQVEIGLKQAFNGKAGSIGPQIIVRFPTKGDLDKDKAFLDSLIDDVTIACYYKLSLD